MYDIQYVYYKEVPAFAASLSSIPQGFFIFFPSVINLFFFI
jgi:hypothetical protein